MLNRPVFAFSRGQALRLLNSRSDVLSVEDRILLLIRAGLLAQAEAELLSSRDLRGSSGSSLMLLLAVARQSISALSDLLEKVVSRSSQYDSAVLWFARQNLLYFRGEYDQVLQLGLPCSSQVTSSCWHHLLLAKALLWLGQLDEAEANRKQWDREFAPPECVEFDARLALLRGNFARSLELLSPLLDENNASPLAWELAIHALDQLGEYSAASVMLQRASVMYPNSSRLLGRRVLNCVQRRQSILARRLSLLERLHFTEDLHILDKQRSHQNLAHAFENGGRPDLLVAIHPFVLNEGKTWQIAGNRALQLASLGSSFTPQALHEAQQLLPREAGALSFKKVFEKTKKLRVGFITSDANYHPVMRFLLMQINQGLSNELEYFVVITGGKSDSFTSLAKDVIRAYGCWLDLRDKTPKEQLALIRDLNLNVAVDLGGWTGNACPALFASRIAPVQVNYLGFFASTGLPEMNFWLGDHALFPDPCQDWSVEQIWRLQRCFVAWQPFNELPEGQVEVPASPVSSDIVFGSFNHVRKLSESTLRLWARILKAVPGSRLALKAYTSDDPGTSILLRRRMQRCGLDPEVVIWLATTPSIQEHLRQYGLLDVALDPFPNGGCTTTCEALWMGVPVITLAGSQYVSRMSAAVLTGADLREWIAVNEDDYLDKAVRAANQRLHLRQSREQLRRHLQTSQLGDAANLNQALCHAWFGMVQTVADSSTVR